MKNSGKSGNAAGSLRHASCDRRHRLVEDGEVGRTVSAGQIRFDQRATVKLEYGMSPISD